MLKARIAVNEEEGSYHKYLPTGSCNQYLPKGIYVRVKPDEINEAYIQKACDIYIPKVYKLPLIIVSYENHKLIASNQDATIEKSLSNRVNELYDLKWAWFQIEFTLHKKATVPYYNYVYKLLQSNFWE